MKRYVLIFDQSGEGCDYTIHCGTATEEWVETEGLDPLVYVKARREYYGHESVEKARLFEIAREIPVPLSEWEKAEERARRASEEAEAEAAERAEFERLQKKFGGGR